MKAVKVIRNVILVLYVICIIAAIAFKVIGWEVVANTSVDGNYLVIVRSDRIVALAIPYLGLVATWLWSLPGKICLGVIGALCLGSFFFLKDPAKKGAQTKDISIVDSFASTADSGTDECMKPQANAEATETDTSNLVQQYEDISDNSEAATGNLMEIGNLTSEESSAPAVIEISNSEETTLLEADKPEETVESEPDSFILAENDIMKPEEPANDKADATEEIDEQHLIESIDNLLADDFSQVSSPDKMIDTSGYELFAPAAEENNLSSDKITELEDLISKDEAARKADVSGQEKAAFEKEIASLKEKVDALEREKEEIRASLSKEIDSYTAALDRKAIELSESEDSNSQSKAEADRLAAELSKAIEERESLKEASSHANEKLSYVLDDKKNAEKQIEDLEKELSELKVSNEAKSTRVIELETMLQESIDMNTSVRESRDQAEINREESERKLQLLEEKTRDLEIAKKNLQSVIENLDSDIANKEAVFEDLRKRYYAVVKLVVDLGKVDASALEREKARYGVE